MATLPGDERDLALVLDELEELELDAQDGPAMPCAPSRARSIVGSALHELGRRDDECEILRPGDLNGAPCLQPSGLPGPAINRVG